MSESIITLSSVSSNSSNLFAAQKMPFTGLQERFAALAKNRILQIASPAAAAVVNNVILRSVTNRLSTFHCTISIDVATFIESIDVSSPFEQLDLLVICEYYFAN